MPKDEFKPGDDPRSTLKRHKERGPKKFTFTYQDIADAVGLSARSVQNAKSNGTLDPTNLLSLVDYINGYDDRLALVPAKPKTLIVPSPSGPIDICQGEVIQTGEIYRCEECYLWTEIAPKHAVHERVLKPTNRCTHESENWYRAEGKLECHVCDTAASMLDREGVCDACAHVVPMDELYIISTPSLAGVAMCMTCRIDNGPYCEIAPKGWWCSRLPDHEGPCAARPDDGLDCRTCGKKRCLCQLDLF